MKYKAEIKGLDLNNPKKIKTHLFDDLGIARLVLTSQLVCDGKLLNLKSLLSTVNFRDIKRKGDGFNLDCDIKLNGKLLTVLHIDFTQVK